MKAQEIINQLNYQSTWVNFQQTRDILLFGDPEQEVTKIGVCWTLTNKVIQQAASLGINFIITHENGFYEEGTTLHQKIITAKQNKKALLAQYGICVTRCHDVWDRMPTYGIPDAWGQIMGINFDTRPVNSFYKYAYFNPCTVQDIAKQIAHQIKPLGEDSVTILGNPNQIIQSIAIGTGAITNVYQMLEQPVDCLVVTDDGINNWNHAQYCIDHDIPLIITHHPIAEIPGMMKMVEYLKQTYSELMITYLDAGYHYHTIQ
jgi:putative NIF3 family GTP cyclohydrolase 1 type 2